MYKVIILPLAKKISEQLPNGMNNEKELGKPDKLKDRKE